MVRHKAVTNYLKEHNLLKSKYLWQLHAYVIPQRTAKLLLSKLPVNQPVDNFIASLVHDGIINAYAFDKQLVRQPDGFVGRSHTDIMHSGRLEKREEITQVLQSSKIKKKSNKRKKI